MPAFAQVLSNTGLLTYLCVGCVPVQVINQHLANSDGSKPFRFTTRQQIVAESQLKTFKDGNAFFESPRWALPILRQACCMNQSCVLTSSDRRRSKRGLHTSFTAVIQISHMLLILRGQSVVAT